MVSKRHRAPCPTCLKQKFACCPSCLGKSKASCHRCEKPIYAGDWVSHETVAEGTLFVEIAFCKKCVGDLGLTTGPRLRLVA